MTARIRVFLLTCRRPQLLRRALGSLLAQTFTDWVCELHNDAPDDDEPRKTLEAMAPGDRRFTYHHHDHNWGAVASFNHALAGAPENFISILEDDNWWEPEFLARLHEALEKNPQVEVACANLRFWREEPNGNWTDLQRTHWPVVPASIVFIATPQLIQFDGPLVSNGAMLLRSAATEGGRLQVSVTLPFAAMENVRERAFRPPILLVPEALANFALTRTTARGDQLGNWIGQQILMAIAFLQAIDPGPEPAARLWKARRSVKPHATAPLFFAGLLTGNLRFLSHGTVGDWLRFLASTLRHPVLAGTAFRARKRQPELARIIDRTTRHLSETSCNFRNAVPPLTLADPADLAVAMAVTSTIIPSVKCLGGS